jgi:hypothetical protein
MSIKMFSVTFRENSMSGSLVKAERQTNTDMANLMDKFSLRMRPKYITYPEKFKSLLLVELEFLGDGNCRCTGFCYLGHLVQTRKGMYGFSDNNEKGM